MRPLLRCECGKLATVEEVMYGDHVCNTAIQPVSGVPVSSLTGGNLELNLKIEIVDGVARVISTVLRSRP